jgi:uncharacterized protein
MTRVLIDSSAFLSLEDADERSHPQVREAFTRLIDSGASLLTTNFVFDECYTLILTRMGRARAFAWGTSVLAGRLVQLFRVEQDHEARAWEIITTFADKDFSYTDATSFAVAESLGIEDALALDRHFRQFGALRVHP